MEVSMGRDEFDEGVKSEGRQPIDERAAKKLFDRYYGGK